MTSTYKPPGSNTGYTVPDLGDPPDVTNHLRLFADDVAQGYRLGGLGVKEHDDITGGNVAPGASHQAARINAGFAADHSEALVTASVTLTSFAITSAGYLELRNEAYALVGRQRYWYDTGGPLQVTVAATVGLSADTKLELVVANDPASAGDISVKSAFMQAFYRRDYN